MTSSPTTLLFLLLFSLPFSFQQSSRQMYGNSMQDYALLGYSFASFNTRDSFSCAHRCLSQHQCKSYNYAVSGAQQGLCELNSAGKDASKPLQYRPGFVFVEALLKKPAANPPKSCFDYWKDGARTSGTYRLNADSDKSFDVYCDLGSEPGWVWTLVMSQGHANRAMPEFRTTSLVDSAPLNEEQLNWEAYRLSLERMKDLKSQSTHWRVTCSFPSHGVDYTDYVRTKFTDFEPLTFKGYEACMKVEYMNVRGHNCTGCTSTWWQRSSDWSLHHDSSFNGCEFQISVGFVSGEDNFGRYKTTNPNFRCSSGDNANTNHWFGRRV